MLGISCQLHHCIFSISDCTNNRNDNYNFSFLPYCIYLSVLLYTELFFIGNFFCKWHWTVTTDSENSSGTCNIVGMRGVGYIWWWIFFLSHFLLFWGHHCTVETLYSTIYYSKYFIELNLDKSTQYVALWTHKRHPIPRPFGRAMECLLWVFKQKLTVL